MNLLQTYLRPSLPVLPALCRTVLERSFQKEQRGALVQEEIEKKRVAAALWKAFPSATSENELAEIAAPYFRKPNGRPVSSRTIRYWLSGYTLPNYLHTRILMELVGVDFFFPEIVIEKRGHA